MIISNRRAYVYVQMPQGEWVTVGRVALIKQRLANAQTMTTGDFVYAPSYCQRADALAIDPVGLSVLSHEAVYPALRYGGLIDIVRDACPDGWGRHLLQRAGRIEANASDFDVALLSSNSDRWGALSLGSSKQPSLALLQSPPLAHLEQLVQEIALLEAFKPAANMQLRRQLLEEQSVGGARPKVTLRDKQRWLMAKPQSRHDSEDIPALEHLTLSVARQVGLRAVKTEYWQTTTGRSVLLVERFDRVGEQRLMTASAATLLQVEYPTGALGGQSASYARLANVLQRIGCPDEDRQELWFRLIFNALVGNDDDHVRNHAVVYCPEQGRWRLSPLFDVVPNVHEQPRYLAMALDMQSRTISKALIVAIAPHFAIVPEQAEALLQDFVRRVELAVRGSLLEGRINRFAT